jgi:hypothetical protein
MQGLVLLLVFFGTAMLVLGTYALINRRRLAATAMLRQRMGDDSPIGTPTANILRDLRRSSLPALDRLLDSMSVSEALDFELRRVRVVRSASSCSAARSPRRSCC